MSDYHPSPDAQERLALDNFEEMRQQFLDLIEGGFERSFAAFSDPEYLALDASRSPDNEADQGRPVRVREIPVVPLGSIGEHCYQPDVQHITIDVESGDPYGMMFEHLLHYDSNIDREFWSDNSSISSGWGDWGTSNDDSDNDAFNDMKPEGYVPSIQTAEITTSESDSEQLLVDYETMMSSEIPPMIPVESSPVAANVQISASSVHQQSGNQTQQTTGEKMTPEPTFMELIRSVRADMTNEHPSAQLQCSSRIQNHIPANRIVNKDDQKRQKKTAVRPSQRRSPYDQVSSCSSSLSTSCKRKADIQQVIINDQDSDSDMSEVFSPPPPLQRPKRRRVQLNDDLFIKPLTPCDELRFMARDLHFKWITIDEAVKRMKDIFDRAQEMLEFWSKRHIECGYIALMETIRQETVLQLIYSLMVEEENPNYDKDDPGQVTQNGGMSDDSADPEYNEGTHVDKDNNAPTIETYSWVSSDSDDSDDDHDGGTHVDNKDNNAPTSETYWVSSDSDDSDDDHDDHDGGTHVDKDNNVPTTETYWVSSDSDDSENDENHAETLGNGDSREHIAVVPIHRNDHV